jgi:hypothetical protein
MSCFCCGFRPGLLPTDARPHNSPADALNVNMDVKKVHLIITTHFDLGMSGVLSVFYFHFD